MRDKKSAGDRFGIAFVCRVRGDLTREPLEEQSERDTNSGNKRNKQRELCHSYS